MVLIIAAVALFWPTSFLCIDTWAINPMLGVIMFGMGLTLSPQDFRIVFSRPKDILIGCLAQFTVMPLLALGLSLAFALPKELALGVILVGCCPGGTASNVLTYLAKGELVGQNGSALWNGLDENGNRVPIGVYVVVTEVFNFDGKVKQFKNAAVVGTR